MDQAQLPLWIEVVRAIGPTIGSLLLVATAATAAIIAWRTYRQRKDADEKVYHQRKEADEKAYRQRKDADERAEWWRRAQWAIDYASDPDTEKVRIGLRTLRFLLTSDLASPEDKALVRALLDVVIATRQNRTYNGSTGSAGSSPRPQRRFPWSRRGE